MKKSIVLICIMLFMMTTYVFAVKNVTPNIIIEEGYKRSSVMKTIDSSTSFERVSKNVTVLLQAIGIGVGACVGLIYAIMWITATPSKKADLKERILPLVLGVILLFGGPGLAAALISGLSGIVT